MSISAERGKPLLDDFNLPVTDFLGTDGAGTLNVPGLNQEISPDSLKVGPDLQKGFDSLTNNLDPLQALASPDQLTSAFMNSLSPNDPNIGNLFGSSDITGLVDEMTSELSSTRRRLRNNPELSSVTQGKHCQLGLSALMRALNNLTDGLFDPITGLMYEIGAWLGLINRMTCAGIPNAFSSLESYIPNRSKVQIAVGSMLTAGKVGSPGTVIDIGNSTAGPLIAQGTVSVASLGAKTLENFDTDTVQDKRAFINDFDQAMSNMDPNWLSVDNYQLNFGEDGTKTPVNNGFRKYLETSIRIKEGAVDPTNLTSPTVDSKMALLAAFNNSEPKLSWKTFLS